MPVCSICGFANVQEGILQICFLWSYCGLAACNPPWYLILIEKGYTPYLLTTHIPNLTNS